MSDRLTEALARCGEHSRVVPEIVEPQAERVLALIQSEECAEVLRRGCMGEWTTQTDKTEKGLRVRVGCTIHGKFGDRTFPPFPDQSDEIRMWVAGRRFAHKDEHRQAALVAFLKEKPDAERP